MSSDSSQSFSDFNGAADSSPSGDPGPSSGPTPLRSWLFIIVHLLASSFFLLFVFWTLVTYGSLEAMRSREAASAHLLIVFDQPPPQKEIAGLQSTLEKIVGAGNVSPMPVQSGQGPTERRTRHRVLSVLLTPGKDPQGRPVLLSDMIRSISQVVQNDARIQDVVYSPDWIARVDSLMFLSLHLRKGLVLVGSLAALSLSLYWGLMGPPLFVRLKRLSRSGEAVEPRPRTTQFRSDDNHPEILPLQEEPPSPPVLKSAFSAAYLGGVSALIVLLFAWSLKSLLFPPALSDFFSLSSAPPREGRFLLFFVLGALAAGFFGGLTTSLFSRRDRHAGASLL